jgi:hypothetical protein
MDSNLLIAMQMQRGFPNININRYSENGHYYCPDLWSYYTTVIYVPAVLHIALSSATTSVFYLK